jgi:CTP synthase
MGGTMRLGAQPTKLVADSKAMKSYGVEDIEERHRHRYEFNNDYRKAFEDAGMRFTGLSPDGGLVEIVEIESHPWFLAAQFHPEFKSKPLKSHPLFTDFIEAAINRRKQRVTEEIAAEPEKPTAS